VYVDELEAGRNSFHLHFQDCFELFVCSDASLARQALGNRPGSVLVAVQRMRDGSGAELISEALRQSPANQCILLHTDADTFALERQPETARIFRLLRLPYHPPVLQTCIECAYDVAWNSMQSFAQRHELETYRHERGILTYKLETEYFDPLHQLERLCESVVAARDFAPAFELAAALGGRLKSLVAGRNRFRELYRGSQVEILVEPLNVEAFLGQVKQNLCEVYELRESQCMLSKAGESVWYGDHEKLHLILIHLLNNAARSRGGNRDHLHIGVGIRIFPEWVVIEVSDNGCGIPLPFHDRVFRMFERGPGGDGSGMGLFIVRETVRKLGGEISLESIVGTGSTFRIRIPNLASPGYRNAI